MDYVDLVVLRSADAPAPPKDWPCGGLFLLQGGQPLAVRIAGAPPAMGERIVFDDVMTSLSLYTFGGQRHARLQISRPSRFGLATLDEYGEAVWGQILPTAPLTQLIECGVLPDARDVWARFADARRTFYQQRFPRVAAQSTYRRVQTWSRPSEAMLARSAKRLSQAPT